MANITISFPHAINVSVQVGDMAYYTSNTSTLGTHTHSNYGDIIQIGEVLIIDRVNNTITCDWAPKPIGSAFPSVNDFIMFSKDNKVNLSSLLGYYANIQFVNNSTEEAELFSVGADVFESSK